MVRPVTTGTTLNMFVAPSKLWATATDENEAVRTMCRSHTRDYALEVLLTSKKPKKKGRNVVS